MGVADETRGPWRVHDVRRAFDNPWIAIDDHAVIQPHGVPGQYGVVHFKNRAIGVLPVTDDGHVPMVGQHRFPGDYYSWELPEGGGPLDEDPLAAAKRELAEETGYRATTWLEVLACDLSNSVTDERAVGYLAWGLRAGDAAPEDTEVLAQRTVRFGALLEDCLSGAVRDSLTILLALAVKAKLDAGALPGDVSAALRLGL
ncbi:MAG: NUDIX hydrolase [Pseudomonadota bacterium]